MRDPYSMPPDWDQAEIHAQTLKPKIKSNAKLSESTDHYCSCCQKIINKDQIPLLSNSKQLEFLGFGFPLFFIFIKYCIILVLILIFTYSGMSLYLAIKQNQSFCNHRNLLASGEVQCTSFMVFFSNISAMIYPEEKMLRILSFFAHMLGLLYMRDLIVKTMEYYGEKTMSPSKYSIQIKDIPPQDKIQSKIKGVVIELFSKLQSQQQRQSRDNFQNDRFKVQQIILLPQSTQLFEMNEIQKKLIEQKRNLYIKSEMSEIQIDSELFKSQIYLINKKINDQAQKIEKEKLQFKDLCQKDKLQSEKAIIILNQQKQKNYILKQFEQNKQQTLELLKKHFGQSGKYILIKQAPQPNQIIWANVNYTRREKIIGHVVGWSLSLLTLIAFTVVYYFLVKQKTQNLIDTIQTTTSIQAAHSSGNYIFAIILVYLNLIFIVLFNKFALGFAFYKFTLLEKHENSCNQEFSFAIKYAMGMFFTTALMTLAVEDITFHNFYSHQYGVIEQESIMFLINAFFVPMIWMLNPEQIYCKIKRYFCKDKTYFTQQQANRIMSDSNYKMGKRYAEIIKTMWFTFLYSTLIPIGAFFSLIGLVIYYWVDKYNLLRRSSIIQNISGKLAVKCMKLLDMTLFFRSIGALYFDYRLRHEINILEVCFSLMGLVYLFLPMNKILRFFHEQKFLEEQFLYEDVKYCFRENYQTSNPIYTKRPLGPSIPLVCNQIINENQYSDQMDPNIDSLHNICFTNQKQQFTKKVNIKPKITEDNQCDEMIDQTQRQNNDNYQNRGIDSLTITKRSVRKRLSKIHNQNQKENNADTLNVQNGNQNQIESEKKEKIKKSKIITPMKINNIR